MSTPADHLILWTSSVAKGKLQALLKLTSVSSRMRSSSWEKQRGQILAWTQAGLADLQLLPEVVRPHTDALLTTGLFPVDASGAIAVGLWPMEPGVWAERKDAELNKFREVAAWVKALLALVAPSPAGGAAGSVGGSTASPAALAGVAAAGAGAAAASGPIGARGSGGGVSAGTAGATGIPGVGTAAAVTPAAVAAMSADEIAVAIATALGHRLDDFSARLSAMEAQGSAPAGATLTSGGSALVEAELFARALRDSVATAEKWDMARCSQVCARLIHEVSRFRPQLTLLKDIHSFGKLPMKALEANAFAHMQYVLSELAEEECELDELPAGREATLEHWKRKRVHFDEDEEEARAAGGGRGLLPPLDAARREHLATLGSDFKTVNDEQLARALHGDLASEDIVRPPGAGALPIAMPSKGPLAGVNLLVAPVQRLQQVDEGGIKWKDGDLTVVPKTKKCKNMDEWERGFFRIMCEAPAEARDDLVDFLARAKTIATDFTFYHFSEFYELLVRQVQRTSVGISFDGYDRVWRVYKQQHSLQPGRPKRRGDYKTRRENDEQPQEPASMADTGKGAKSKGGGKAVLEEEGISRRLLCRRGSRKAGGPGGGGGSRSPE
ncbi:hypothetical protein CYMTET_28110 [Cymbomonas tetramitiformis]|uniref:Uncharacterized protein n=1 Tax=Cymbomonas tetramitiformis TaxID=36881 RepID=A0AAE0FP27_9CHLO|nr:hypothetical protein CYMTET_28110 [Cymbomonas tetramitiformis]